MVGQNRMETQQDKEGQALRALPAVLFGFFGPNQSFEGFSLLHACGLFVFSVPSYKRTRVCKLKSHGLI